MSKERGTRGRGSKLEEVVGSERSEGGLGEWFNCSLASPLRRHRYTKLTT